MGVGASAKGKEVTSKADSADSAKSSAAPSVPPAAKSEEVAEMGNELVGSGCSGATGKMPAIIELVSAPFGRRQYDDVMINIHVLGRSTRARAKDFLLGPLVGKGIFAIQGATV